MLFHSPLADSKQSLFSILLKDLESCQKYEYFYIKCKRFFNLRVKIDGTKKQDTVFDPISLTCGHIYYYMCACSAASVNVVDGMKTADSSEKCPLCRDVRPILHCFIDLI